MHISRRTLLRTSALGSVAALAACGVVSSTTSNGVTTITVNVAQVAAWGAAIKNGAALIAGLPGVAGTPQGAVVMAIVAVVTADLAAFSTAAGGSVSLTFNSTSVPAAVSSLLTDGKTLLTDAQGALGNVGATVLATAQTYVAAVQTIVALFEAALGSTAVGAAAPKMTEAQALTVLGVAAH